jgi:type I restriction enzyme S subunit
MKTQNKIPEDWELKELKDIFTIETGTTPPTKEKIYWENANINWATPADLGKLNGNIHFQESERKISETALRDVNLTLMPEKTIIVSTRAPVGYAVVIKKESTFNQGCKGLIPKKENDADPYYYCYYLLNNNYELQNRAGQSTFKELSKQMFENFEVLHPPFKEQKAISKILCEVDLRLDNVERERQATERLRRGIMVKLLEEKKWKFESLNNKEYFELIMGQSPPSSSYNDKQDGMPFLQGNADFGVMYPSYSKYTKNPLKIAEPNDILISVRAPVGEINLSKDKICMGRGLGAIRVLKGNYLFYYYYLNHIKREIENMGQGSTFKAITLNELRKISLPIPSLKEQERIVFILSTVDQKLELEQKSKDKLERFKKGLMNDLLTGNKRVNVENVLKIGGKNGS